jgi:HK97 family phage portal protein
MGLFDRLSRRSAAIPISDPAVNDMLRDAIMLEGTYTGSTVTVEKSLRLVPVFSAVNLLASAVGTLPLRVYKSLPDGGKELASQHRASRLLTVQPNPLTSADEFFESITAGVLLWGNAFILKEFDETNQNLKYLWPISPSRVRVGREPQTGFPQYFVDGRGPYTNDTIIHIRGLSFDGLVGLSPIQQARQTLGIHSALEQYSGSFWANSARPSGVLKHPNRLTAEAAERLRAQWTSSHKTTDARVAILEEGMTFEAMSLPAEDAQLIETLHLGDIRIAQLFRVPPRMLMTGVGDSSLHYSSAEWEAIDFVKWSLRRWLVRIENALLRDPDVFKSNGLGAMYFPRFDTKEITRGDRSGQAATDIALLQAGILSVDEVRANLDMNPAGDPTVESIAGSETA